MLDSERGEVCVRHKVSMHSRFGEQFSEYLDMPLAGRWYPDRIAR